MVDSSVPDARGKPGKWRRVRQQPMSAPKQAASPVLHVGFGKRGWFVTSAGACGDEVSVSGGRDCVPALIQNRLVDGLGLNRGSRAACGSEGERAANSPVLDLHRPALYRDALSAMGVGILENALAPVARRSHRGRRRRLEPRSRMTWSWTLLGHIKSSWFCRNIFQKNQTP